MPQLAAALAARGHAVTIIQAFHTAARLRRGDVDIVMTGVASPRDTQRRQIAEIVRQLALLRPQVAHVFGLTLLRPLAAIAKASAETGVKVSASFHGGAPRRGPIGRIRQRRALAKLAAIFFPAAQYANEWQRHRVLDPGTRIVIAPEVSSPLTPVDRDAARSELGVETGPLLVWSARLHPIKDPLTALRGFESLVERQAGARLLMAFRTRELLHEVSAYIESRPAMRDRVRLLGEWPHERMAVLFSAADFFVQSSIREFGGNSLVEAMSCGAVPVVTDIPSFRALTDDGRFALLFPPGDSAAMARAIATIADRDRRDLAERVRGHFDEKRSYHALARLYDATFAGIVGQA